MAAKCMTGQLALAGQCTHWNVPNRHVHALVRLRPILKCQCTRIPSTCTSGGIIREGPVHYSGWCPRCHTDHTLHVDDQAVQAAAHLKSMIEHHQRFDYEVPVDQADDAFSIEYVWTKGPGRMLGVMVARRPVRQGDGDDEDEEGGKRHDVVVLKAFSGQLTERWECPGFVGPVAGIHTTTHTYKQSRAEIEALSRQITHLDQEQGVTTSSSDDDDLPTRGNGHEEATPASAQGKGRKKVQRSDLKRFRHRPRQTRDHWPEWAKEQYKKLVQDRKAMSHDLMSKVQASYMTYNLSGNSLSLLDAYQLYISERGEPAKTQGFPAGTGDCCTPKLLHAALQQGLEPLSVCEFWFGSPPSTNTPQGRAAQARRGSLTPSGVTPPSRVHGVVYGPCGKCQTILGAMLCRADDHKVAE